MSPDEASPNKLLLARLMQMWDSNLTRLRVLISLLLGPLDDF